MDIKKLQVVTVVAPIAFVLVLEELSLAVMKPLFGNNATVRLSVIFLIVIATIIPFRSESSRWSSASSGTLPEVSNCLAR